MKQLGHQVIGLSLFHVIRTESFEKGFLMMHESRDCLEVTPDEQQATAPETHDYN